MCHILHVFLNFFIVFIVFREGSRLRWRISCQQGIRRRLRMVKCYAPSGHNVNINEHLEFKPIKTSMKTFYPALATMEREIYLLKIDTLSYLLGTPIIQHPMQILSQQSDEKPLKNATSHQSRATRESHRKPPKATDARATTAPKKTSLLLVISQVLLVHLKVST